MVYVFILDVLFLIAALVWLWRILNPRPRHLRRKEEALQYEFMAGVYERKAQRDSRYAEFTEYYRREYERRKKWLA